MMWCDAKDKGHAFDAAEAITVTHGDSKRAFCAAHCISAFAAAFHAARTTGHARIWATALGGSFTITPAATEPPPGDQQPDGQPPEDKPAQPDAAPRARRNPAVQP